MAKEPIVDPSALAQVLKASGVSPRTVKKVTDANARQKPVVGQGAVELPKITRL
jgi:hypothetical protein